MKDESIIYLDYNSTTPVASEVVSAITESLQRDWANPSSASAAGHRARETIHRARAAVARLINAADAADIVFTSGGTESNNMAIHSTVEWGRQFITTPHVVMSNVEHVATVEPVRRLADKGVISYTEVAVNSDGCLEAADVVAAVKPDTVLVSVMMANNETGVVFPIREIARLLKRVNDSCKHKVWLHVDAAQAVGKLPVDVRYLQVDYLTIVGHKFYGPRIGALYVHRNLGAPVTPVVWGGGQEVGLRPGTENTPMIAGLGQAAALVADNLQTYTDTMRNTRDYLVKQLQEQTGCVVNCCQSPRLPNTASMSWSQCTLSGSELLAQCPTLVASTTAACHDQTQLSSVLLASGVPENLAYSTIRLSVGRETTCADIDKAVEELVKALKQTTSTESSISS
ncbi:selenocysteine lyase-like [Macrosteles quadrilineatus]|uniref:selenocysteine lyase-like n=1 Tax=Macrosteles quadrilineatus TaxID=74068 RepID=UPI0023E23939|nr:selenocysteine lyase-like [Macrosteles quadrilineatus]XP_054286016.1 selenocysteine lyase-like [Macrosteles quadrilineatus]XP_054286017.1 selenocysteine lyase-like [Macrosteles quadrilineatus]